MSVTDLAVEERHDIPKGHPFMMEIWYRTSGQRMRLFATLKSSGSNKIRIGSARKNKGKMKISENSLLALKLINPSNIIRSSERGKDQLS